MKIIQSYNTFGGDYDRSKCGFSTLQEFKNYLTSSYQVHSNLGVEYKLYTDQDGAEIVSDIISSEHIEIVIFPKVARGRYVYSGKMYAHELQTEAYMHVDMDATLFYIPNTDKDVISEGKQSAGGYYMTHHLLDINVRKLPHRYWSGIIGFNNIAFKDMYIQEVKSRYPLLDNLEITKEICICLEETLLSRLIKDDSDIKVHVLSNNDFEHLRDKLK